MDGFSKGTIAALFYPRPARVDLVEIGERISSALGEACVSGDVETSEPAAATSYAFAGMEVSLAKAELHDEFGAAPGTVILIAVDGPVGANTQTLCDILLRLVEARVPASGTVMVETDTPFSLETLPAQLDALLETYAPPKTGPQAAPAPPSHRRADLFTSFAPKDLSANLVSRFDTELAHRDAAREVPRAAEPRRRSPGPTLFPATTFGEPRPLPPPRGSRAMSAFARLRRQPVPDDDALFPDTEVAHARPLVHRGAIHSLNAAMLAFSLPMGAFLIILAALGRESLAMSARMSAVTGAGIGIAQNETVASFVTTLV